MSRIETGGTVRFGPCVISRDGVAKDGDEVAWPNVAGVQITNGMVYVNRLDRPAGMTATAGEVPNAVAFSELARYLREGRAKSPGKRPGTAGIAQQSRFPGRAPTSID